jgi:hypothetical protein
VGSVRERGGGGSASFTVLLSYLHPAPATLFILVYIVTVAGVAAALLPPTPDIIAAINVTGIRSTKLKIYGWCP